MNFDENVHVYAPINIALIKYWGKENEDKIIPKNNSISLTLDKNQINSTTHLSVSTLIEENSILLNNKQAKVTSRIIAVFKEALNRSKLSLALQNSLKFKITSTNNFPTGAGLASSASGMAAFAFGLGEIFKLSSADVSILARLGSGSATRSVFGGIVEWVKEFDNGESRALQLYDEFYWPELRILICVVDGTEKTVSSTGGMQSCLKTSQLYQYRIEVCVKRNLNQLKNALSTKNFTELAMVTMRESNQLHAVCMDTTPPIVYLNSASFKIIDFVNIVNDTYCSFFSLSSPTYILAYTFDAGPNAFLICEQQSIPLVQRLLNFAFGLNLDSFCHINHDKNTGDNFDDIYQAIISKLRQCSGTIEYVIPSLIGSGPERIFDP